MDLTPPLWTGGISLLVKVQPCDATPVGKLPCKVALQQQARPSLMLLVLRLDNFLPRSIVKTLTTAWATLVELMACVSTVWRITAAIARKDSSRESLAAKKSVETSMIAMVFHAVQQVLALMRLDLLYVSAALATAMNKEIQAALVFPTLATCQCMRTRS